MQIEMVLFLLAAMLILETEKHAMDRGADIYAEILGYGVSSDAYHLVQPDKDGDGAFRAIMNSLKDSQITKSEIDYINAHGTSTPMNDLSETLAIKKTFGSLAPKIPISSTKSMIGHVLGGAGALEAVASILSIVNGVIHPTINYKTPDKQCDLDYVPNKSRVKDIQKALSNSFGFGGQNACLVLRAFDQ